MVGAVGQYVLDGTEAEVPGEEQICTHVAAGLWWACLHHRNQPEAFWQQALATAHSSPKQVNATDMNMAAPHCLC